MSRKREPMMLLMISAILVAPSTPMTMIQPAEWENEEIDTQFNIFKILIVEEAYSRKERRGFVDGQHLIEALNDFAPWNNSTDSIALIYFLSYSNRSDLSPISQRYYRGNITYENLKKGSDFLESSSDEELSILYYAGHVDKPWLGRNADVVIVDACWAGDWIYELENKTVLCSSDEEQAWNAWPQTDAPGDWGIFTGLVNARYSKNIIEPLGVIGALYATDDVNEDGWIQFSEVFSFANSSTERYMTYSFGDIRQNPVIHNGLGRDLPFVMRKKVYKSCDIDDNSVVDIFDVVIVTKAFKTYPRYERWNPIADLDSDLHVDIEDIELVGESFGSENQK